MESVWIYLRVHAIINKTTTLELLIFKGLDIRQLITTAKEWNQLDAPAGLSWPLETIPPQSWTVHTIINNTTLERLSFKGLDI